MQIIVYQPSKFVKASTVQPSPSAFIDPLSWLCCHEERRAFAYFVNLVAPILSGAFDAQYWNVLLPQLAHSSVVVKYGIPAIAYFFEHPFRGVRNGRVMINQIAEKHLIGLRWHAKALSVARPNQCTTEADVLVGSIIFATLEFQQNNFEAGLHLLRTVFTISAPLLAGIPGITSVSGAIEASEALLPLAMRSSCLLFSSLQQDSYHTSLTIDAMQLCQISEVEELEKAILFTMCIVYGFLKDSYFAVGVRSRSQMCKLEIIRQQLLSLTHRLRNILVHHCEINNRQQILTDYCDICMSWLATMSTAFQSPSLSGQHYLHQIFRHIQHLTVNASTLYPAATSTMFFHDLVITPAAYLTALLLEPRPAKEESFRQSHKQPSARRVNVQRHAIVLSTGGLEFSSSELQADKIQRLGDSGVDRIWTMTKICDLGDQAPPV